VDHDQIRPLGQHDFLESEHDLRDLLGMRARADAQVHVRRGQPELDEEDPPRHAFVVVLPGVHKALLQAGEGSQGPHDGCDFHEVGTRADDMADTHERDATTRTGARPTQRSPVPPTRPPPDKLSWTGVLPGRARRLPNYPTDAMVPACYDLTRSRLRTAAPARGCRGDRRTRSRRSVVVEVANGSKAADHGEFLSHGQEPGNGPDRNAQ
jgi:hypothetical protein